MKYTIALLIASTVGHAAVQTITPKEGADAAIPPQQMQGSSTQSYMMISPVSRAEDFQQVFEMLRKEKTTGKVYFRLADGLMISNVIEMTLLPNSTLVLFRFNSAQGIRFQVVKVEDISAIGY
jgi:hypothetical protein